jgi:hypothetical protein
MTAETVQEEESAIILLGERYKRPDTSYSAQFTSHKRIGKKTVRSTRNQKRKANLGTQENKMLHDVQANIKETSTFREDTYS